MIHSLVPASEPSPETQSARRLFQNREGKRKKKRKNPSLTLHFVAAVFLSPTLPSLVHHQEDHISFTSQRGYKTIWRCGPIVGILLTKIFLQFGVPFYLLYTLFVIIFTHLEQCEWLAFNTIWKQRRQLVKRNQEESDSKLQLPKVYAF